MKVRLEDVCEILDSKRIPIKEADRNVGIYPYYGANGIQGYIDDYIFDDELVLLAEDGGHFGSKDKPIAYRVSGKCWVNNHAHVLKPKETIDVDYLCYSLMFYDVSSFINGATRKKLTQLDMRKIEIPFRPINEQKRIAKTLDKVNELITKRHKQLEKLDELVKKRFVEMFGDPITSNSKCSKVPLSSLVEIGSSKRIFEREYTNKGVPFYRTKEIVELSKGNKISNELFISIERYNEIVKEYGVPKPGDLLISAVGTIGIIWIVDGETDFYFKDGNILYVSPKNNFTPVYLKFLLEALIDAYKIKMSSGTAYAALTISALKKMHVYKVPMIKQKQFAIFVEEINKLKLSFKKNLCKLELLKKSLMQKYFMGSAYCE